MDEKYQLVIDIFYLEGDSHSERAQEIAAIRDI